jgi:8-oxo-dGTP pyrophosphatase MutT (NUDIX family)
MINRDRRLLFAAIVVATIAYRNLRRRRRKHVEQDSTTTLYSQGVSLLIRQGGGNETLTRYRPCLLRQVKPGSRPACKVNLCIHERTTASCTAIILHDAAACCGAAECKSDDSRTGSRILNACVAVGHAEVDPAVGTEDCPCETLSSHTNFVWSPKLAVRSTMRVAACCVVEDDRGRILLTRRAQHMRSFPKAWVLPGGGVDAGETIAAAAAREVLEETGMYIDMASLQVLPAAWESCFPNQLANVLATGGVSGHYLVIYCRARLATGQRPENVCLQAEETDCAVWVQPTTVVNNWNTDHSSTAAADDNTITVVPSAVPVDVEQQLCGAAWPNAHGEGIAEGHRYVLKRMLPRAPRIKIR